MEVKGLISISKREFFKEALRVNSFESIEQKDTRNFFSEFVELS